MYSFTEDLAGTFLWTQALNFNLFNSRQVHWITQLTCQAKAPLTSMGNQWEVHRQTSLPGFNCRMQIFGVALWNVFRREKINGRACHSPNECGKWSQHMLRAKMKASIFAVSCNCKFVFRKKARPFPAWNTTDIWLCKAALWARLACSLASCCFSSLFLLEHRKGTEGPESSFDLRKPESKMLLSRFQRSSSS